jgi:phosphate:Na+ symporter
VRKVVLGLLVAALSYLFIMNGSFLLLFSGIAIFIFGMIVMGWGFRSFSGGTLERLLGRYTSTKLRSVVFGILATTAMQSSTLISLVTISFLSAGLITLAQGVGIILGSQIGTTSGAWLVAGLGVKVDIAKYAMPIVVFGVIFMLQSPRNLKSLGQVLVGIGLLFLGVAYIKDGFDAVGSHFDLVQYGMDGLKGVLLFFGVGMLLAIITQSSLAAIVITIAAMDAGQVSYANALAIVIGANLGTTATGLVSSLGSNIAGKRLAVVYLLFNIFICSLSILFLRQLMFIVDAESYLLSIAPDNYALKLAVFHTTINILGVGALYPFIGRIASVMERLMRQKSSAWYEDDDVLYVNESALEHEDAAREALRREICHLYQNAAQIMSLGIHVPLSELHQGLNPRDIINGRTQVIDFDFEQMYERRIKAIYGKILSFIIADQVRIQNIYLIRGLGEVQRAAMGIIEALKDVKHLQKNLINCMGEPHSAALGEYNAMREQILSLLMVLGGVFDDSLSLAASREALKSLENEAEEAKTSAATRLAELLNSAQVSAMAATSIVKDSAATADIADKLLFAAKIVIAMRDITISAATYVSEREAQAALEAAKAEEKAHDEVKKRAKKGKKKKK